MVRRTGQNELKIVTVMMVALVAGALTVSEIPHAMAQTFPDPSRSTSIALTSDDRRLVVANRESNSVSIIQVRNAEGQDGNTKLIEIEVGQDPRYVAIRPDDSFAFVSNSASGTVSVIPLDGPRIYQVVRTIRVGSEPRGMAITPNGTFLYVANHTSGTVSVIDTSTGEVSGTIELGGNPTAIAITNDADTEDTDERVFVTQFYAELIDGGREGFDDGKQGIVNTFPVGGTTADVERITLAPLPDSGFTADRTAFCPDSTGRIFQLGDAI